MWAFVGFAGHLAKLVNGEGNPENAKVSPSHLTALKKLVYKKILPHSAPSITRREDVTVNALKTYQYEFFRYCTHDSVLTIFLAVVMALTLE